MNSPIICSRLKAVNSRSTTSTKTWDVILINSCSWNHLRNRTDSHWKM